MQIKILMKKESQVCNNIIVLHVLNIAWKLHILCTTVQCDQPMFAPIRCTWTMNYYNVTAFMVSYNYSNTEVLSPDGIQWACSLWFVWLQYTAIRLFTFIYHCSMGCPGRHGSFPTTIQTPLWETWQDYQVIELLNCVYAYFLYCVLPGVIVLRLGTEYNRSYFLLTLSELIDMLPEQTDIWIP